MEASCKSQTDIPQRTRAVLEAEGRWVLASEFSTWQKEGVALYNSIWLISRRLKSIFGMEGAFLDSHSHLSTNYLKKRHLASWVKLQKSYLTFQIQFFTWISWAISFLWLLDYELLNCLWGKFQNRSTRAHLVRMWTWEWMVILKKSVKCPESKWPFPHTQQLLSDFPPGGGLIQTA